MSAAQSLVRALGRHDRLAIAVSGGIDSTVLSHMAQATLGDRARMIHAISPAVPAAATDRVRRHAQAAGWRLDIVDAGEFGDARYRENPLERCYFCKLNLYGTIAGMVDGAIASGTNTDDLGDFRPGLRAAEEWRVSHPYVEAGLGKDEIYALARLMGHEDLAELPAQPCLASRIETGLRVTEADLAFVEAVEALLHRQLGTGAVLRCRMTHQGVIVELGTSPAGAPDFGAIAGMVEARCIEADRRFLGLRPYRRGAAFLTEATA